MLVRDIVQEDLANWGEDWVHFTKHPMLTINPQQMHRDPAGIYFFPASVNPEAEMWRIMPYKFTVNIKSGAHVFDVSNATPEQIYQMVDAAGGNAREMFDAYITQYPPKDIHKMFDMAWERLQAYYGYEGGKLRQYASFNAMLQGLGWQAIFDDTGSIHSGEKEQLLVLDPRIITNVRMEQQSGSGFAPMQAIVNQLAAMCQPYGQVIIGRIQKPNRNTYYTERDNLLMCRVEVTNSPHANDPTQYDPHATYCVFMVRIRKQFPDRISVSIQSSNPRLNYGAGSEYSISQNRPIWNDGGIENLRRELDMIFTPPQPQQPVAEVRKVPGPQLVGSGKDFRQNAGTNRSGKQPGRLVGSGKPLKVKPGFVG